MSYIYLTCPQCGEEAMELEVEYERADPEVGIMNGGYVLQEEVPKQCPQPECGHVFTAEEYDELVKQAERKTENKAGDEADAWADYEADRYFDEHGRY